MDAGLAAEPTTDLRRDDPDIGTVHPERRRELPVQPVGHLRRCPERQAPGVVDLGRRAVGLHRHHRDALVDVAPAHDVVGAGEAVDRRIDVHLGLVRTVRLEDDRRVVVERGLGVDHHGQRVDVGPHCLRGVLALLHRLGEHDGDRLTDEAHPAVGQRRPDEVGMHGHEAVMRRHAQRLGGEDGDDAGHPERIVDMDGAEHAMGHVGADEHGMQPVDEWQVGQILPGTREQPRILGAGHPRPENRTRAGVGSRHAVGDGHTAEPTARPSPVAR